MRGGAVTAVLLKRAHTGKVRFVMAYRYVHSHQDNLVATNDR